MDEDGCGGGGMNNGGGYGFYCCFGGIDPRRKIGMGRGMMDISETDVARNGRIHAQIFYGCHVFCAG